VQVTYFKWIVKTLQVTSCTVSVLFLTKWNTNMICNAFENKHWEPKKLTRHKVLIPTGSPKQVWFPMQAGVLWHLFHKFLTCDLFHKFVRYITSFTASHKRMQQHCAQLSTVVSWVKKVSKARYCNFTTDTANFNRQKLRVLKIQLCPKITTKWQFLALNVCYLDVNFSEEKTAKISEPKISGEGGEATLPLCHWLSSKN